MILHFALLIYLDLSIWKHHFKFLWGPHREWQFSRALHCYVSIESEGSEENISSATSVSEQSQKMLARWMFHSLGYAGRTSIFDAGCQNKISWSESVMFILIFKCIDRLLKFLSFFFQRVLRTDNHITNLCHSSWDENKSLLTL